MAHTTTTNSTCYARIVLALVFSVFAASAQAATIYNFTFANRSDSSVIANGFFTTDGAAVDAGYELIASITFDQIVGMTGTVYAGPFKATTFEAGAAYNPATGGFLNHAGGGSYSGLGLTTTYRHPWGQTVEIYGYAFRPNVIDVNYSCRLTTTISAGRLDAAMATPSQREREGGARPVTRQPT
jgi:hypothetical protein